MKILNQWIKKKKKLFGFFLTIVMKHILNILLEQIVVLILCDSVSNLGDFKKDLQQIPKKLMIKVVGQ